MARQIGHFFLFIGLITLVIFGGSAYARQPAWNYGLIGFALFAFGFFLSLRNPVPKTPSNRFQFVRKIREHQAQKRLRDLEESKEDREGN
jgi:hypothetical protein